MWRFLLNSDDLKENARRKREVATGWLNIASWHNLFFELHISSTEKVVGILFFITRQSNEVKPALGLQMKWITLKYHFSFACVAHLSNEEIIRRNNQKILAVSRIPAFSLVSGLSNLFSTFLSHSFPSSLCTAAPYLKKIGGKGRLYTGYSFLITNHNVNNIESK